MKFSSRLTGVLLFVTGAVFLPSSTALAQSAPPAPTLPEPIVAGDPTATVSGIVPDATVVILYVEGQPAGFTNPGGADTVDVPSAFLFEGLSVTATQETALGGMSAASTPVVVQAPAPPPAPVIQGPIYSDETSVTVTGVVADASTVIIFVEGGPAGFIVPAGADIVDVASAFLIEGLNVTAIQETLLGGASVASAPVVVQGPTPVPAPVVVGPIYEGDVSVTVSGIVPDATTAILFVEGEPAGFVIPGGAGTVDIPSSFMMEGLAVTAVQETAIGGVSAVSNAVVVDPFPVHPLEGAVMNRIHLNFGWFPVSGADSYQLWVVEDDGSPDPFAAGPAAVMGIPRNLAVVTGGLAFGKAYAWRVRGIAGGPMPWGPTRRFSTAPLPAFIPGINITRSAGAVEPGLTMFIVLDRGGSIPNESLAMAVDEFGNLVWFLVLPFEGGLDLRLLDSGEILFIAFVATLDGEITWASPPSETIHHEVFPMPNGNILALGQNTREVIRDGQVQMWVGDTILEFERATNAVVWSWNAFDHVSTLDFDPAVMATPDDDDGTFDWTHANAVVYNELDNSVYISIRHLSRVTRIDYATGQIVYNMGLTMPSGDTDFGDGLFTFQHAPQLLPNGNMMLYDNGNRRDGIVHTNNSGTGVTKAIELSFDDNQAPTNASIVWEWTHPSYSGIVGDTDRLPNGNTLTTGRKGFIYEVDADGNLVWQLELTGSNSFLLYRAERISTLYPALPGNF